MREIIIREISFAHRCRKNNWLVGDTLKAVLIDTLLSVQNKTFYYKITAIGKKEVLVIDTDSLIEKVFDPTRFKVSLYKNSSLANFHPWRRKLTNKLDPFEEIKKTSILKTANAIKNINIKGFVLDVNDKGKITLTENKTFLVQKALYHIKTGDFELATSYLKKFLS